MYKKGMHETALEYIQKAIQSGGGDDPDIMEHYGDILYALDRQEEAAKAWKKAIELGGESNELREKVNSIK
jgi:predicted negative regulator of RcsB-dependent stress response